MKELAISPASSEAGAAIKSLLEDDEVAPRKSAEAPQNIAEGMIKNAEGNIKICQSNTHKDLHKDSQKDIQKDAQDAAAPKLPEDVCFPRSLAISHGIPTALLSGYIAVKCLNSRNLRDGRRWFFDSVSAFEGKFSYLTNNQIRRALEKARKVGLITATSQYNRMRGDRTKWYAPSEELTASISQDRIHFNPANAVAHGVEAAILLNHVQRMQRKYKTQEVAIQPAPLSRYLPLSPFRINKAFKLLQERGLI